MDKAKTIEPSTITDSIIDTKERIRLFLLFQAQRDAELMNKVQSVADKLDEIGRGVEKRDSAIVKIWIAFKDSVAFLHGKIKDIRID
jgi:hypothetical protein